MTITELFARTFKERAGETALEFAGRTFTFGELDARADRVATLLKARGFCPGDRLAVYLENRVEFIDLFLACTRAGVILVPINVLYRDRELAHIVSDAEPRAIVAAGPIPGGAAYWDVAELSQVAVGEAASGGRGAQGSDLATDITPAAIVYTSGTTGTAKGAILTHGNFAANARTLLEAWQITSKDRFLLPLPLFHVHGLGNGLCCWLASGCRMRLLTKFDAATAEQEFESFAPTLFFGVPTIYVRLLALPVDATVRAGKTMRLFVSGSAPLAAHIFEEFRTKFGHAILERYGMTETFMNIGNPYDGERRPGTVGKPLPGVHVRIVPFDSRPPAPTAREEPGEPIGPVGPAGSEEPVRGEVQVRGANVFAGYWRRPDATEAAFTDGWFKTGDIGQRSADGYITLCGRMGDVIISGGFNIYPREIEETLLTHPGIRECAVVGSPDPVRGEVPVAYLVTDGSVDDEAIRERLGRELASFKMPRAFVRMDVLPRTALGKIQRHLLPPVK